MSADGSSILPRPALPSTQGTLTNKPTNDWPTEAWYLMWQVGTHPVTEIFTGTWDVAAKHALERRNELQEQTGEPTILAQFKIHRMSM